MLVNYLYTLLTEGRRITATSISKVHITEIDGIDTADYPDFVDAYVSAAEWTDLGTALTEDQLEELNAKYSEIVHAKALDTLF